MPDKCFHPEQWRDRRDCDTCRYRNALERIVVMSIGPGFEQTTRTGKAINLAIELAAKALYPEPVNVQS